MMDPELDADNPLLKKEQDAQVFDKCLYMSFELSQSIVLPTV